MTTKHTPATPLPFVAEGFVSGSDDGKIYVSKGSKICETRFDDKKNNAFQVRCAATLGNTKPFGTNWIEFSITEYGEKRNKFASFCLRDLEQIRRLRNVCDLALLRELGEA